MQTYNESIGAQEGPGGSVDFHRGHCQGVLGIHARNTTPARVDEVIRKSAFAAVDILDKCQRLTARAAER